MIQSFNDTKLCCTNLIIYISHHIYISNFHGHNTSEKMKHGGAAVSVIEKTRCNNFVHYDCG